MHRPWSHCSHSANGWSFGDHGAQLCCSPARTGRKFARSVAQKRAVTAVQNTCAPWLNTVNAPCSAILCSGPPFTAARIATASQFFGRRRHDRLVRNQDLRTVWRDLSKTATASSQIAAPQRVCRHPGPCLAGRGPGDLVDVHRTTEGVARTCRRDPHDNRCSCNPQRCGARTRILADTGHANRSVSKGCAPSRSDPRGTMTMQSPSGLFAFARFDRRRAAPPSRPILKRTAAQPRACARPGRNRRRADRRSFRRSAPRAFPFPAARPEPSLCSG
jgi:hypothetical protein